jgi:hypothetical protein
MAKQARFIERTPLHENHTGKACRTQAFGLGGNLRRRGEFPFQQGMLPAFRGRARQECKPMRFGHKTAILFATLLLPAAAMAQTSVLEVDQPMMVNGVETVCTGTTTDVREDPRWRAYPFHLEFAGKDGQYLGDETVSVSGNGHSVSVHCEGPWVLMKLPSGTYKVSADVAEAGHKDVTVHAPGRTVLHFPNAGGEVGPSGKVAAR